MVRFEIIDKIEFPVRRTWIVIKFGVAFHVRSTTSNQLCVYLYILFTCEVNGFLRSISMDDEVKINKRHWRMYEIHICECMRAMNASSSSTTPSDIKIQRKYHFHMHYALRLMQTYTHTPAPSRDARLSEIHTWLISNAKNFPSPWIFPIYRSSHVVRPTHTLTWILLCVAWTHK